jgi:hypothetical protein
MIRTRQWLGDHIGDELTFEIGSVRATRVLQYGNDKYFFQVGYHYFDAEKCLIQ